MDNIYIRTKAYNAENTLRRAVDSVLNQTYGDFIYYLLDNGSTDGTGEIIKEYAACDNRIRPFFNKENRVYQEDTNEFRYLRDNIGDEDFYCTLDADDEYMPTFLEEMLHFIYEYDLDVAACGYSVFDATDNSFMFQQVLNKNLILSGNGFVDYFPILYSFIRNTWGKLYRGRTVKYINQQFKESKYPLSSVFGGDTRGGLRALSNTNHLGIYAKTLHRYYRSEKSASRTYKPKWLLTGPVILEESVDYLKSFGALNDRNNDFIYFIYFTFICSALFRILKSKIPLKEKYQGIITILIHKYTRIMIFKKMLRIYRIRKALMNDPLLPNYSPLMRHMKRKK